MLIVFSIIGIQQQSEAFSQDTLVNTSNLELQRSVISDSLRNYLQIALKANPLVMQRFAEYNAALQRIPQVGALPDPELTVGVFLTPMELIMGEQIADLEIMQMFPWFGVLKNAKDEMSLMAKASFESFRNAKLEVMYDVHRTWYEIYKLQQFINITKRNLQILNTIEQLTLSRYRSGSINNSPVQSGSIGNNSQQSSDNGNLNSGINRSVSNMNRQSGMNTMASGNSGMTVQSQSMQGSMQSGSGSGLTDLYRIQIESGNLQNQIALLIDQKNSILARFNSYLNRKPLSFVWIPDTLLVENSVFEHYAVPDSIESGNPMLAMILFEQQSLVAREEMNRRMGLPMIGLGVNYSVINKLDMSEAEMNGRDMIMPMLKITIPVYRKKYAAMQNEASALRTASEMNYIETLNNLISEYYEALQLLNDSNRRIKLYGEQKKLAERSLDVMIVGFSNSTLPLSDVLRSQQQLLDYEMRQVEAVADFNTSLIWLRKLSGSVPEI